VGFRGIRVEGHSLRCGNFLKISSFGGTFICVNVGFYEMMWILGKIKMRESEFFLFFFQNLLTLVFF
jgi:hypothetical protein